VTGAIAIFVKTPGLSPVKTRLAADIGRTAAEVWYMEAAAAVAEVACATITPTIYWAIAESDSHVSDCWTGFQKLAQGEGGLGARMASVHTYLVEQHGYAVLLGADTPQIDAAELRLALQWLATGVPRAAIGPARDGGFWMFGSNRCIALSDWNSVVYSRADTRARFQRALSRYGFDWQHLALRTDVDTAADLQRCMLELNALGAALPGQIKLTSSMRGLLKGADVGATTP
jgi:uncharacterized protein